MVLSSLKHHPTHLKCFVVVAFRRGMRDKKMLK
jgi:hypothetical protein